MVFINSFGVQFVALHQNIHKGTSLCTTQLDHASQQFSLQMQNSPLPFPDPIDITSYKEQTINKKERALQQVKVLMERNTLTYMCWCKDDSQSHQVIGVQSIEEQVSWWAGNCTPNKQVDEDINNFHISVCCWTGNCTPTKRVDEGIFPHLKY